MKRVISGSLLNLAAKKNNASVRVSGKRRLRRVLKKMHGGVSRQLLEREHGKPSADEISFSQRRQQHYVMQYVAYSRRICCHAISVYLVTRQEMLRSTLASSTAETGPSAESFEGV